MSGSEGKSAWKTFNKMFDALFAEDCCDEHGRLHYICQGKFCMESVCQYLAKLDLTAMPQDLMTLKLNCLNEEILHLMYMSVSYKVPINLPNWANPALSPMTMALMPFPKFVFWVQRSNQKCMDHLKTMWLLLFQQQILEILMLTGPWHEGQREASWEKAEEKENQDQPTESVLWLWRINVWALPHLDHGSLHPFHY